MFPFNACYITFTVTVTVKMHDQRINRQKYLSFLIIYFLFATMTDEWFQTTQYLRSSFVLLSYCVGLLGSRNPSRSPLLGIGIHTDSKVQSLAKRPNQSKVFRHQREEVDYCHTLLRIPSYNSKH